MDLTGFDAAPSVRRSQRGRDATELRRQCDGSDSVPAPAPRLAVRLIRLDKTVYQPGERIDYEIAITNTGRQPLSLPVARSERSIEPGLPRTNTSR